MMSSFKKTVLGAFAATAMFIGVNANNAQACDHCLAGDLTSVAEAAGIMALGPNQVGGGTILSTNKVTADLDRSGGELVAKTSSEGVMFGEIHGTGITQLTAMNDGTAYVDRNIRGTCGLQGSVWSSSSEQQEGALFGSHTGLLAMTDVNHEAGVKLRPGSIETWSVGTLDGLSLGNTSQLAEFEGGAYGN